jgi:hypothetical protein
MRSPRLVSYFRHAVLLTLSLPACGGATGIASSSDASADAPPPLPTTPCNWAAGGASACAWNFTFTGDPATCTGFTGSGSPAQCLAVCSTDQGAAPTSCSVVSSPDGGTGYLYCNTTANGPCIPPGNGGRRPGYFAQLGFEAPPQGREVGVHFARVACMEAGSVEAFRQLRAELVAHRAPRRLVRAASRAIRDEVRHVRATSALARRFGEVPIAPLPVPSRAIRSLAAMALENAVEGCVRETYSALECAWQAHVAVDPVVRAAMKRIARDELRHLALAWDVHSWTMGKLARADRARVRAAQRCEIAVLAGELSTDPHASLLATAGLPRAYQSRALIDSIARAAA